MYSQNFFLSVCLSVTFSHFMYMFNIPIFQVLFNVVPFHCVTSSR